MEKEFNKRILNRWNLSREVLSRGISVLEKLEGENKGKMLLGVLKNEEEKIKREIRKRVEKMKKEMEIDGMKSLKERVKVEVENVNLGKKGTSEFKRKRDKETKKKEENGNWENSENAENGEKRGKLEKNFGEFFKCKNVFDFREYSSDFTNLNPAKIDGKISAKITKAEICDSQKKETQTNNANVQFKRELTFILPLKQMFKKSQKTKWTGKPAKKPILKNGEKPAPIAKKLNRKKLKKIISKSINCNLKIQKN